MSVRRKSSRRRRDDSDSDSSSSDDESSSDRPEDLFKSLKGALVDRSTSSVYRAIQRLERNYKETQGILRIAIPDSFSFSQGDIEEFFKKFGRIERIVLKQNIGKTVVEEQLKSKEGSSIAYVIYCEYCSAILAMKVLNSVSEKERIFTAKICHTHPISSEAKLFCEPLIGTHAIEDMIITVPRVSPRPLRTASSETWSTPTSTWGQSAWTCWKKTTTFANASWGCRYDWL